VRETEREEKEEGRQKKERKKEREKTEREGDREHIRGSHDGIWMAYSQGLPFFVVNPFARYRPAVEPLSRPHKCMR